MNLVLAFAFSGILQMIANYQLGFMNSEFGSLVIIMFFAVVKINIVLMVFNLLPIPPLDGFGIVTEVFNLREKEWYYQIYDKGFMILLLLMIFNVTDKVLVPSISFALSALSHIFPILQWFI